jgi:phage tail tape-measure protein
MKTFKLATLAGAIALALGVSSAYADDQSSTNNTQATTQSQPMTGKEKATAVGAGTGAVAGAVVGGPVGAVVGAGIGAVVGHEGTDANGHVTHTGSNGNWSHDDVSKAQSALNDKGYNVDVDGRFGPQTSDAVRHFQTDNGLAANGRLDDATLKALGVRG